jgi:4-carboxymuconolactone decarboxylase
MSEIMVRLQPVVYEELTAEQQKVYDLVCSTRDKTLGGPHLVKIFFPELEIRQQEINNLLRRDTKLKKTQFEMLTLIAARQYNVAYMWGVHERDGVKEGLSQAVMDAINHRKTPVFEDEADKLMYEVASTVVKGEVIPQKLFDRAIEVLGEEHLIEAISDVGYYSSSAITVNTYDITPRPGTPPLAV